MRSDAIDRLFSRYLKQPVRMSWEGGTRDVISGEFADARLELTGLATAWLPVERLVLRAGRASFRPGLPPSLVVEQPEIVVALGQADVDDYLGRFQLPFKLDLAEKGLVVHTRIAGFPLGEFETQLNVVDGWFILKPRRASILGVPGYVSSLFRTYLPVPALTETTRLARIRHEPGELQLTLAVDDFEEDLTPGLVDRLRQRILPSS